MEYIIESSVIILMFYVFYKTILQQETFFQSNRIFLVIGIISSILIPLIVIPIYVEATSINITQPLSNSETFEINNIEYFNWSIVIDTIYISGILLLISKLIVNLFSLFTLIKNSEKIKNGTHTYVSTQKETTPFSFFNFIVYNPSLFKNDELQQIITHEKIHANQLHSIDIILAQLLTIIFWFNPVTWLYKKEIEKNLEYIADEKAQNKIDCEKSYQKLLLKTSLHKNQLVLTNNFYNSLIKKRIVMLHKNRSKNTNQWKYVLIIPFLTVFMFIFNTKIVAQNWTTEENEEISFKHELISINKDTKDKELSDVKKKLKKEGITANFKDIKRNKKGEIIKISISIKSENSNASYNLNSDNPINPIHISWDENGNNISIMNSKMKNHKKGYYFVSKDGDQKIITKAKGNKHFVVEMDEDQDLDNDSENLYVIKSPNNDGKVKIIELDEDNENTDEHDIVWVNNKKNKRVKVISDNENVFISDIDNDALIYINGKKASKKDMDNLSPSEIEKMEILKGESATKKYGKKAKDGVILITTKKK